MVSLKRLNCLTRMRMLTKEMRLNFSHSGSPFRTRENLRPCYVFNDPAWSDTRIVFDHWSALGLIVLPDLVSLDKKTPRIYQVTGQS